MDVAAQRPSAATVSCGRFHLLEVETTCPSDSLCLPLWRLCCAEGSQSALVHGDGHALTSKIFSKIAPLEHPRGTLQSCNEEATISMRLIPSPPIEDNLHVDTMLHNHPCYILFFSIEALDCAISTWGAAGGKRTNSTGA